MDDSKIVRIIRLIQAHRGAARNFGPCERIFEVRPPANTVNTNKEDL